MLSNLNNNNLSMVELKNYFNNTENHDYNEQEKSKNNNVKNSNSNEFEKQKLSSMKNFQSNIQEQ